MRPGIPLFMHVTIETFLILACLIQYFFQNFIFLEIDRFLNNGQNLQNAVNIC